MNFFVNEKKIILKKTPKKKKKNFQLFLQKFHKFPKKNANNQIPDQKKIRSNLAIN